MATILEFPKNAHLELMSQNEPPPLLNLKISFFSHIDEVFSDYKERRATLAEVSDQMKSIVADLVESFDERKPI
jgi:hypothetical protein